jgi:hypothetical protein
MLQKAIQENNIDPEVIENLEIISTIQNKASEFYKHSLISLIIREISVQLSNLLLQAPPFLVNVIEDVGNPTEEKLRDHNSQLNRCLFDFLKSVDANTTYDSYLQFYRNFSGLSFNIFLFGLEISLRNLPARLLKLTFASFDGTFLSGTLVERPKLERAVARQRN